MFNKSLNSILKTFEKTHAQLETFADKARHTADELYESSAILKDEADEKIREARRAETVKKKIAELIS